MTNIPGVLSSVYSYSVPGGDYISSYSEMENAKGETQKTTLNVYLIDYDYINQYKLKLVAGRNFSKDFGTDATQAMINFWDVLMLSLFYSVMSFE